jgi:hypothetical protein
MHRGNEVVHVELQRAVAEGVIGTARVAFGNLTNLSALPPSGFRLFRDTAESRVSRIHAGARAFAELPDVDGVSSQR